MDKCAVQKTQVLKVVNAKLNYEDKAGKQNKKTKVGL